MATENNISNRAHLRRLIQKGLIEACCVYHLTDDYAHDNANNGGKTGWMKAEYREPGQDRSYTHGVMQFDGFDFECAGGRVYKNEKGNWNLRIHSNLMYEVRFAEQPATDEPAPVAEPEQQAAYSTPKPAKTAATAPQVRLSYSHAVKASERPKITQSDDVHDLLRPLYADVMDYRERFIVLLLDRSNRVLGHYTVSEGTVAGCLVDAKLVFQAAILANASALILSHNHPSGNLTPSQADKDLTRKIKEGAKILDLTLFDHVILAEDTYFSMADEGHI